MNYGLKYYMEWLSEKGNDYRIEIQEKDFTGQAMLKKLGSAPVLRLDNADNGIIGTSLQFLLQADVDGELAELYTTDSKKFKVVLKVDGAFIWEGYILQELYSEEYIAPPYDVSITATDQIALLKDEPYAPSVFGRKKLLKIVRDALQPTQLNLGYLVQSSLKPASMGENSTVMDYARINDSAFEGLSCYDVLSQIMSTLNMCLVQFEYAWTMYRKNDFEAPMCIYEKDELKMRGKFTWPVSQIGRMHEDDTYPIGSLTLTKQPAKKSALISFAPVLGLSMLKNPQMASADHWEYDQEYIFEKPGRMPIEEGSEQTVRLEAFVLSSTKEQSKDVTLWQTIEVEPAVNTISLEFSYLPTYKLAYLLEGNQGGSEQLPSSYDKTVKLVVDVWLDAEDGQRWHLTKNGWSNWDTSDSIIFTGEMKFHQATTLANKEEYTKGTIQMTGFPAKGSLKVGFRNDSRITYDIVPVPTIMPAQARVAVTDVLLTFGEMQGYYSDVAIAPSAAQKAEDVELFFSDSSGVANEQLIFYNYIDFATADKVSAWQLGGVEFGSFYRAMVQDFANSVGFIRNGFSGVIRSFNPLNIAYIEKYSQSKLRLLSGEYNLLTDELSGEWEEVKEQMAEIGDYEITEESNSTNPGTTGGSSSGGGSSAGGGGGTSGITMADVEGAIAPIKDWFVVQELDNGQKILRTKYNLVSDGDVVAGAESDFEINGGEAGGGGGSEELQNAVIENEEVTAGALVNLNDRLKAIDEKIDEESATKKELQDAADEADQKIEYNEIVATRALLDVNDKLENVCHLVEQAATKAQLDKAIDKEAEITIDNEQIIANAFSVIYQEIKEIKQRLYQIERR